MDYFCACKILFAANGNDMIFNRFFGYKNGNVDPIIKKLVFNIGQSIEIMRKRAAEPFNRTFLNRPKA